MIDQVFLFLFKLTPPASLSASFSVKGVTAAYVTGEPGNELVKKGDSFHYT